MPPVLNVMDRRGLLRHGQNPYGPYLTRDLIVDQTPETLIDVNAGAVWAFDPVEGLGVAAAAGESIWYLPGDLARMNLVSEWKFISSAAGRYMGMVVRAQTPGAGTLGYYLLGIKNNTDVCISSVTGAGTADHATNGITALTENEIFRLQARVVANYDAVSQSIYCEHVSHGKITNSPGAANYNLAAIADPCYLRITVDGGTTDVEFASTDPLIAAFNAVTNAEVADVINDQLVGIRAWVPAGATYVAINSNSWGTSSSLLAGIVLPNANVALGFPLALATGAITQAAIGSASRIRGFNGLIGGHGGNTAQWVRSYSMTGI